MTLDSLTKPDLSRLRSNTYSTGIHALDTELLQGIPHGSVIGIISDPRTQYELMNYHLVHTDRPTAYISTNRPGRLIKEDINTLGTLNGTLTVKDVFGTSSEVKKVILTHANRIEPNTNYILDTVNSYRLLEENGDMFLQTLRNLYISVHDKNAMAYLNFTQTHTEQPDPYIKAAMNMCDGIFNIHTEIKERDINSLLEIRRMRKRSYPSETIKLDFDKILSVDTTRNIA